MGKGTFKKFVQNADTVFVRKINVQLEQELCSFLTTEKECERERGRQKPFQGVRSKSVQVNEKFQRKGVS